jgi:type III secretion protein SpaR/YscT/HrcT
MPTLIETDSYLNLFFSLPNINPTTVLSALFLSLARIFPITMLAPFFGAKNVPAPIRVMFSLSLIAIILPNILLHLKTNIPFDISYPFFLLKEFFIGFMLGLLVAIPFYIAQSAGSLTDHMRGAQSLQVTDPTTSSQTGPIGIFYNYVLIAVFYSIGGPFIFLDALAKSYMIIPITKFINPVFFSINLPVWKLIIGLANYILSMAIQLAAPSLIGVLMAEMFLGIANRLAPQVQIVFLGISLKSWVGLALLAAAWYFIMIQLGKESENWLKIINNTLEKTSKIM